MARKNTETEPNEIYRAAIEAVGPKKMAQALGLSVSHLHRFARPTMDVDPDGTGARSDLDRLEVMVDLLAARPEGHPVLMQLSSYLTAMLDRARGAWEPRALSRDDLARETGEVLQQFGELLRECGPGLNPRRVQKEGAEAIAAIEHLMRSTRGGLEVQQEVRTVAERRVG